MDDITTGYLKLFNAITDATLQLEEIKSNLVSVQQNAEDLYIESADKADQQKCIG